MKRICSLALVMIITFGLGDCSENKPTNSQKQNLSPEQKEIAELVEKIGKETGVESKKPLVLWETIKERGVFNDESGFDEIIRNDLQWCLKALGRAEERLAEGKTEEAQKEITFARDVMFQKFSEHLASRKVELNSEVKSLLKQYWEVRKRLENYEKEGIKPIHDQYGEYTRAKELHQLYFDTGAISISYARLEETITYLKEAVKNVRAAEILFDREWSKKLEQIH